MQMNRLRLAPVVLLVTVACNGFPFFWHKASPPPASQASDDTDSLAHCDQVYPRAKLEVQELHYDGESLSGRLLVSAEGGSLRLDKRLFSNIDVNVLSVRDCGTQMRVPYIIMDAFTLRGRQEDLLVLNPGYWYGAPMLFPLFAPELNGIGPECIDVELYLLSFEGKCIGLGKIRAMRDSQATTDGGMSGDLPPVTDPGVPDAGVRVMP